MKIIAQKYKYIICIGLSGGLYDRDSHWYYNSHKLSSFPMLQVFSDLRQAPQIARPFGSRICISKILVPYPGCQTSLGCGCLPPLQVHLHWEQILLTSQVLSHSLRRRARKPQSVLPLGISSSASFLEIDHDTYSFKSVYVNDSFHSQISDPNWSWIVIHSGARIILLSPLGSIFLHHLAIEGHFLSYKTGLNLDLNYLILKNIRESITLPISSFPLWLLKLCPFLGTNSKLTMKDSVFSETFPGPERTNEKLYRLLQSIM